MQNAHLRLGRLNYLRSSTKTQTHISVHVSHYVGEAEQAHLLSFFGNDAEVGAVTAAIQEKHLFELTFPDGQKQRIGFGADPAIYKASLNLPQHRRTLRHVIAVSSWLHGNGGAGRTFLLDGDSESHDLAWATLVSLQGLPADPSWADHMMQALRDEDKVKPIAGIGLSPVVVEATREELLHRIGNARQGKLISFPSTNGPVRWSSFGMRMALGAQ